MLRATLLVCACAFLSSCTVVDLGVGRGANWKMGGAGGYADVARPANDKLLTADIIGPTSGSLVSIDLWRLLHVELGLIGAGIGIGPLQAGGGFLWYTPELPLEMKAGKFFAWPDYSHHNP